MSVITTIIVADRLADLRCDAWRIVAMKNADYEWGFTMPPHEEAILRRGMRDGTIIAAQGPGTGDVIRYQYAKLPDPLPPRRRGA